MGTKTKFIINKMCIGYIRDFKKALDWQRKLTDAGVAVQTVTMSVSVPDDDIDNKKYRYVMDTGVSCIVSNDIEEYLQFLISY